MLASALVAAGPVPARAMALREGWAVAAAETEGAGVYAPAPLPGPAIRVRPGDPMPDGRDAVLDPFDAMEAGDGVMAMQAVAAGDGVHPPGADIAAGSVIRAAGERLRARDLPALAALG
ncbi:MAG: molybdopterin biosynthesis protein, partial [Roseomonas sp.]|nr:molybdopterin biosynthesis protein [Roseomonas sp.]